MTLIHRRIRNFKDKFEMKSRVFVSSVIDGFDDVRESSRLGILKANCEPVLVNEDFPSISQSSRNACLDGVESSDIFILIIGNRGGWKTPSGKLVVEEEFLHAKKHKLPILLFLQNVLRDTEGQRLAQELSDYVDGFYRKTFTTTAELQDLIYQSLQPLINHQKNIPMNTTIIQEFFISPFEIPNHTSLRLVLSPERQEEVINPVQLVSQKFLSSIYEISHHNNIKLLNYQNPKVHTIQGNSLIIHQQHNRIQNQLTDEVRIEIIENGIVIIDSNVTGRVARHDGIGFVDIMMVSTDTITQLLETYFKFIFAFYENLDQFKRHQQFLFNVALIGLGYKTLVKEIKEQRSYAMNIFGNDKPIPVYETPRLIGRIDMNNPNDEIDRIITLLQRKVTTKI